MRFKALWCVLFSLALVGMTGCGDDSSGGGSTGEGLLGPGGGSGGGDSNSTASNATVNNSTVSNNGTMDSNGTMTRTLAILGNGAHTMDAVVADRMLGAPEGLAGPRDLEFKPDAEMELWVLNQDDNSMTIVQNVGSPIQDIMTVSHFSGGHFMIKPMSLAFGQMGKLATIHETDEITQPTTPADFMGPTLHSSRLNEFDGGHGGHMDMLHNSPNGVGIAWERDNIYWIFDGYHSAITRYNFNSDHGLGGSDHSDGEVDRFIEGEVTRVPGVLSKLVFDQTTQMIYIADSGNNRILMLDPESGIVGGRISPNYDGIRQNMRDNAEFSVVVDGAVDDVMVRPSGIVLHNDVLFVTDNARGRILGFDRADGTLIDYLDTGLPDGALMGIAFDASGHLYYVDAASEEVWRVKPLM